MKQIAVILIAFASQTLWAFPEMVRHGYAQCTACHMSPSGGGVLNKYGRELSAELLSTWSYENESQFLHSQIGKDLMEKGIFVGGDLRAAQVYAKDTSSETAKLFMMMANIQGAYQSGKFVGVMSIGELEHPMDQGGLHGNFNATEYYGMLNFTDEISVRAGRFMPAFGINFPDHTLAIKEMIGFVPTFELDTVEGDYLNENWTIQASVARTAPKYRQSRQESVGSFNIDYSFLERMRAGISYWSGQGPVVNRHMTSLHGIFGITKRFYNMTEFDIKDEPGKRGQFGLTQLAYELFKGFTPYLQYQHAQEDLNDGATLARMYGAGFHFYPRPHFEISGEWDHILTDTQWSDSAYLLGHYYF